MQVRLYLWDCWIVLSWAASNADPSGKMLTKDTLGDWTTLHLVHRETGESCYHKLGDKDWLALVPTLRRVTFTAQADAPSEPAGKDASATEIQIRKGLPRKR